MLDFEKQQCKTGSGPDDYNDFQYYIDFKHNKYYLINQKDLYEIYKRISANQ